MRRERNVLKMSRALWNRSGLTLESDEALAQLLDRGQMAEWRELYRMAKSDARLRSRIQRIIQTVPVSLPHFWLHESRGCFQSAILRNFECQRLVDPSADTVDALSRHGLLGCFNQV